MAFKKIVLTPQEKEIENLIDAGQARPASDAKKARYLAAIGRKVEALRHGGARPGAGRKRLGHIPTVLALDPEVRAYLVKEAGGKARGMSEVVNRVFGAKLKKAAL